MRPTSPAIVHAPAPTAAQAPEAAITQPPAPTIIQTPATAIDPIFLNSTRTWLRYFIKNGDTNAIFNLLFDPQSKLQYSYAQTLLSTPCYSDLKPLEFFNQQITEEQLLRIPATVAFIRKILNPENY